jgi:hypothetical protein
MGQSRVKYPWHYGKIPYIYVVSFPDPKVLKIGFGTNEPHKVLRTANQRYRRYTGGDLGGSLVWYRLYSSTQDEAILQGLAGKAFGVAFAPEHTRVSEWVKYDDEAEALAYLSTWYDLAQDLTKTALGRVH